MSVTVSTLLNAVTATGAGSSFSGRGHKVFQAYGTTTNGAGSATIVVEGSLDNTNWNTIDTLSLTLATTTSSDAGENSFPYAYVRGRVSAISGTGASVTLLMGK
jgi:hypothetical protein